MDLCGFRLIWENSPDEFKVLIYIHEPGDGCISWGKKMVLNILWKEDSSVHLKIELGKKLKHIWGFNKICTSSAFCFVPNPFMQHNIYMHRWIQMDSGFRKQLAETRWAHAWISVDRSSNSSSLLHPAQEDGEDHSFSPHRLNVYGSS